MKTHTYLLTHSIQKSARQYPQKVAFRCLDQSITYAELNVQVNQLAHQLLNLGVKKGDRVGVFLNRCLDTTTALYGIMNAGAVYVPIDPNLPKERIQFLIEDCEIEYLVTNSAQKRNLKKVFHENSSLKGIIGINADLSVPNFSWESVFQLPDTNPNINILEQDLAYILYTSGSTGTPKGIVHSHYSGLAYAKLMADLYDIKAEDVLGNHAPIFFDISTFGYFTAPLVGATTIIATDAHVKMPASLSQLIEKEKVSVWYSVPLALIQMMQLGALEQRNWSAMRWVLYAGEPFPVKHLKTLMKQLPNTSFSNLYGPTETNVCTYYHLPPPTVDDSPIPIGRVWGNTEMLILDDRNEEVVQGEVGELLIRSATRMVGYWKKPELSERSYYKRSNIIGLEEIFYRTGDLVKEENDGNLTLLGRKDRQVKTRGFRVELNEIEAVLLAHDSVNAVAVFSVQDQEEINIICAIVTLKEKQALEERELLDYSKNKLAWYAVPQQLSISEDLPRTPTGKIDRKVLKANFKLHNS